MAWSPLCPRGTAWPAGTSFAGIAQLPNGNALVVMGDGSNARDITHSAVWRYSIPSSSWTLIAGQANASRVNAIKSTVGSTTVYSSAAAVAGYAPNGRSHRSSVDLRRRELRHLPQRRVEPRPRNGRVDLLGRRRGLDRAATEHAYIHRTCRDTKHSRLAPLGVLRDKLWMFGGDNEECYADLWTFDTASPASGWAFVGGAQGDP